MSPQSETSSLISERLHLIKGLASLWNVQLASRSVCAGHDAPIDFLAEQIIDRPPASLWIGPRGGGKSYISGLGAWVDSISYDKHGTCILGGSLAQSEQIYEALTSFDNVRPDASPVTLTKRLAKFTTGSTVSILAASSTSVRGPHVARLRLDEVDEIDEDIREAALGMCMELHGASASIVMTSTWHRLGGPMAALVEQAESGAFPIHRFCAFEVLERCPEWRSGSMLERCPECPLKKWCHADRHQHNGIPKAKRSDGHYTIDSLIQKVRTLSPRVFESDYLCMGPKASGLWFSRFDARNISEEGEYNERFPVHIAIDSGVHTGAVFFQTIEVDGVPRCNVFAEYLVEGKSAEVAAKEIIDVMNSRCFGARRRVSTDSAGGARNPVGPTVISEYDRAGLRGDRGIETWPKYPGCVADGLNLIDAMVRSADESVSLHIHPRCKKTIDAFRSYSRAKRSGQWQDYPEDPQHPHEDIIDSLRGGLSLLYPEGRRVEPTWYRRRASQVF